MSGWVRTVAVALVEAAALTACGGATDTAPESAGSTPVISAAATPSVGAPVSTVAVPASTAPVPTAPQEGAAADVQVDLTVQEPGLALIALTNTGTEDLRIQGWPSITLRNAADEPVPVPIEEVLVPGDGPAITLEPGVTVFAGMKWTVGDKADPDTFVATTVEVAPSGDTPGVAARFIGDDGQPASYVEFVATSVQVGTWQPASQGVLVF